MAANSKEKQFMSYWAEPGGQVFFDDGWGWGIDEELRTICLGREEDIKSFFETGELKGETHPKQRQILNEIREYRKELLNGEQRANIKKRITIRSRPAGTVKRRTANRRHLKKRERVAVH
ncbi:hypothetical protein ACFLV0_00785 [Chloroflexota bacterium]